MAYPPPVPPVGRLNTTPQADNHPSDHNVISQALTGIINELGTNPSGPHGTVQTRVTANENNKLNKSGGVMSGTLDMNGHLIVGVGSPQDDYHAANRLWVVNNTVGINGDSMTGPLIVGGDPASTDGTKIFHDTGAISNAVNTDDYNINLRKGTSGDTVGNQYIHFETGAPPGSGAGGIAVASASSVAYNTSSDHRLKQPEGPVQDPAGRVKALAALAFQGRWIADEGGGQSWDMMNAHDIATVAPYVVQGVKDAVDGEGQPLYQVADYGALVPLLVAALGDALARIEVLEAG